MSETETDVEGMLRRLLRATDREAMRQVSRLSQRDFGQLASRLLTVQQNQRRETQILYYRPVSDKAMEFHTSEEQTVAIGGGNRCIPLLAPVLMADGYWRPLGEIVPGDVVMGADPETGDVQPARVIRVFRSGRKEVYCVTFTDGSSFEATLDHRVPCRVGSGALEKLTLRQILPLLRSTTFFCVSPAKRTVLNAAEIKTIGIRECGDIEIDHPSHCYVTGDHVIVSNSGKTSTCLADMVMSTTGIWSIAVREALAEIDSTRGDPEGTALARRFRGPTSVRVVCESLTTTLHQTILPKLQWWKWTGVDAPGGDRGHWGWVPRDCLIGGSWERSWSEKLRTLRVLCRDPNDRARVVGESTWQFMSHDQDPTDFASGAFHAILHDEPPRYAIWRENEARAISVSGRLFVAMTWPDDPSIPVDWIYDRIYEPAQREGSGVRWLNLWMTENPHIDQAAVEAQRAKWDDQTVQVRVYGRPIRFSNRVHPLFTKESESWCFDCGKPGTADLDESGTEVCSRCRSRRVRDYAHVVDFEANPHWPTLFVLDPHPRKPHMFCWIQVDPGDDLWVVAEGECPGDPMTLRAAVAETEESLRLEVRQRLIDPNMGRSPSSSIRREATWQDDFDAVGLVCDLADDGEVGRSRVNEMLRPDPDTMAPRLHVHPRCNRLIHQMLRYVWDDYRQSLERDIKQRPKTKDDDYPTMLKYAMNAAPSFRGLTGATGIVRRRETSARSARFREAQWNVRS